jgi:hypothetical protein
VTVLAYVDVGSGNVDKTVVNELVFNALFVFRNRYFSETEPLLTIDGTSFHPLRVAVKVLAPAAALENDSNETDRASSSPMTSTTPTTRPYMHYVG